GSMNLYLTELGKAHLANHDPAAALIATTSATNLHREQEFVKPQGFPSQGIWWRHVQALAANNKTEEIEPTLKIAYDLLLAEIKNLRDIGLRRNYLNKTPVNRELIPFWVKFGLEHGMPEDEIFSYLNIESNIREPFKRLAATSLRLNALHTVSEIQAFIVEEATELNGGERVMLILETEGQLRVVESTLPRGEQPEAVLDSIRPYLSGNRSVQLIKNREQSPAGAFSPGQTRIIAPLIAQNQVMGYLYTDMDMLYGELDETDRDMLGMLANQAAVALDNAHMLESLEQKVAERTEELKARIDELAILNSVGEAMAKTLDVRTVTHIVGDKLRDIFNVEVVSIRLFDEQSQMIHSAYTYDKEEGGYVEYLQPFQLGKGLTSRIIQTRQSLLLGSIDEQRANGAYFSPEQLAQSTGTWTQSWLGVPIVVNEKVLGVVNIADYDRNVFNASHLNLLQTLASNMGVAIANARLF
ncbi:MAG TPA: GAF domain-containing protein, partial [Pseudomonadales bacterium]|nr:GAF domain-containing protein [Pseudomonadales bacterium]